MPNFCCGCAGCVINGSQTCKDSKFVQPIWSALENADFIMLTSPAYVFHAIGAMKNSLDHLACNWIPHRPKKTMFGKRALILSQCMGAGVNSTIKDMAHSLNWWGVSKVKKVDFRYKQYRNYKVIKK